MSNKNKIHKTSILDDDGVDFDSNQIIRNFLRFVSTIQFQVIAIVTLAITDIASLITNGLIQNVPEYLIFFLVDTSFFFISIHVMFPFLAKSRITLVTLISNISLWITVLILIHLILHAVFSTNSLSFFKNLKPFFVTNAIHRAIQMFMLSTFYWSAIAIKKLLTKEQILESNILYQRLNPHLLFNALNIIHTSLSGKFPGEAEIIMSVSQYARNAMAELGSDGKGSLATELEQLKKVIQINELTFGTVFIEYHENLPENTEDFRIPPQLIVTLAENVFKYGIFKDPKRPAKICISIEGRSLQVIMTNWKEINPRGISSNIGLHSVRKRLSNIYGKAHSFSIQEDESTFTVQLSIPMI